MRTTVAGRVLVLLIGILATPGRAAAVAGEAPAAAMRWTDPDGKTLPFASDDELLVFLRTADVQSEKELSGGITVPKKLLLEKDGVRANAVFRDVHEEKSGATFSGGVGDLFFRDNYVFEPAAYELSRLLGLDNVPPATLRKLHGKKGSVQIWVEHAMTETKRVKDKIEPPDEARWKKQLQMMNVFDALVYNTDRNRGNILITPDWKLWMIDHTRAFRRNTELQDAAALKQCERGMYEKLKALDEAVARERLKEYLSNLEINAMLKRRKLILERLDQLIVGNGEDAVLYVYTEPPPASPPPPNP
ncbi:MAG: hypothetical protein ABI968_04460 [Acidobacteriota bacterium]